MEDKQKFKLLICSLITTLAFLYFVTNGPSGIGVVMFFVIQAGLFYAIMPKKKTILLFIPIVLISLNWLISASYLWRVSNVIIILLLYSMYALLLTKRLNFKSDLFVFLKNTLEHIFEPLNSLYLPFEWTPKAFKGNSNKVKRVLIGLVIAIPLVIILILLLSSADMIFKESVQRIFGDFFAFLNIGFVFKLFISIAIGLYAFGLMYTLFKPVKLTEYKGKEGKVQDTLILNIILISVCVVYTLFMIVQFRYLFAGDTLPYGLSYAEYARRGFFELLALSFINIALIIVIIYFTKNKNKTEIKLNKILLYFLATITIILLASSFYRMYLYSGDYGLTRLRLFVFGFLIFETLAILATYIYIAKPKFNIMAVYFAIFLGYYIVLNLVPTDRYIAKNLIDKYEAKEMYEIDYVFNLSLDAAPEIKRLLTDEKYRSDAEFYFEERFDNLNDNWQNYNIGIEKAKEVKENIEIIVPY